MTPEPRTAQQVLSVLRAAGWRAELDGSRARRLDAWVTLRHFSPGPPPGVVVAAQPVDQRRKRHPQVLGLGKPFQGLFGPVLPGRVSESSPARSVTVIRNRRRSAGSFSRVTMPMRSSRSTVWLIVCSSTRVAPAVGVATWNRPAQGQHAEAGMCRVIRP